MKDVIEHYLMSVADKHKGKENKWRDWKSPRMPSKKKKKRMWERNASVTNKMLVSFLCMMKIFHTPFLPM